MTCVNLDEGAETIAGTHSAASSKAEKGIVRDLRLAVSSMSLEAIGGDCRWHVPPVGHTASIPSFHPIQQEVG